MHTFPNHTTSPLSSGGSKSSQPERTRRRGHEPSGATVLLLESEVLVRHVLAEFLRECGHKVVEAADADEAVIVLTEAGLAVDVVLAEAQQPGNGFALAQWIRAHRPGLHVILAGSVTRAVDAASELCDGDERVSKPYDPQVVHERIRRLLASRTRRSG